ncbi:hypothetical protein N6H18_00450 [Reichenbachiella agarivorans]|uniref:Uncharacterized protein n=1 Tax=Reichenbachiella agarivorans TaxID=2979464 RepID=A0ABY6CW08_9BACT|nr:hypothetical protein [Reichenbachiella agarivorans]UXP32445.1 hypothetical protein N6H18_00450 [Reichenbachiella agarivorans]
MNVVFKLLLYPWALMTGFFACWRKRQFEMGVWKSVAFELPTLAILCNPEDNILPTLHWLDQTLRKNNHQPTVLMHQSISRQLGFENQTLEGAEYIHPVLHTRTDLKAFAYRNSPVLPMSESVSLYPDHDVFALIKTKLHNEVRHEVSVLLSWVDRPYWKEKFWPIGNRFESMVNLRDVAIVMFSFTSPLPDFAKCVHEARQYCGEQVQVVFLELESDDACAVKRLYYSEDQTEFIEDHDTFGRMFITSLFRERN